jgi:hypothetical protein
MKFSRRAILKASAAVAAMSPALGSLLAACGVPVSPPVPDAGPGPQCFTSYGYGYVYGYGYGYGNFTQCTASATPPHEWDARRGPGRTASL